MLSLLYSMALSFILLYIFSFTGGNGDAQSHHIKHIVVFISHILQYPLLPVLWYHNLWFLLYYIGIGFFYGIGASNNIHVGYYSLKNGFHIHKVESYLNILEFIIFSELFNYDISIPFKIFLCTQIYAILHSYISIVFVNNMIMDGDEGNFTKFTYNTVIQIVLLPFCILYILSNVLYIPLIYSVIVGLLSFLFLTLTERKLRSYFNSQLPW
jgi:hypothetical protein